MTKFLVKRHCQVYKTNRNNRTPEEIALHYGYPQIAQYLQDKIIRRQLRASMRRFDARLNPSDITTTLTDQFETLRSAKLTREKAGEGKNGILRWIYQLTKPDTQVESKSIESS